MVASISSCPIGLGIAIASIDRPLDTFNWWYSPHRLFTSDIRPSGDMRLRWLRALGGARLVVGERPVQKFS